MKEYRVIVLLLVLLLLVPATFAQTGGDETPGGDTSAGDTPASDIPIRKDTPITVHLEGDTPIILGYKTSGEEVISITARSLEPEDALDPLLTVIDATGVTIATNDDHRTSRTDLAPRDALIADLNLSDSGRYTIQVESFDANAQGDVEVLITGGGSVVPEPIANETINDRVPNNDAYSYNFAANQGEVMTITVRATDNQLDPKVSLIDSGGIVVADNDDHASSDSALGPYDSQIVNFTIPKTDTYAIQITGFAGIGGTFELTINRGGAEQIPINPTTPPPVPTTAPDQTTEVVEGTVNPNDVYAYPLPAQAGEVYTITVLATSDRFDPRVAIYFADDYVMDNDDYGSTDPNLQVTDSRIYNLIITESGTYDIEVRGYQESSGNFRMTIERVASDAPTGLPTERVELGSLQSGNTYTLDFDAQAGDWVTISVRALTQDFDPYVALLSADGTVLLDNDDHSTSTGQLAFYDAQIPNYHITESGTYTVEVSGVGGVSGSFGVTIATLR